MAAGSGLEFSPRQLLVNSIADCLETVYEVTTEYGDEFKALGGEHVQLVESLNDSPKWIEALEKMVIPQTP